MSRAAVRACRLLLNALAVYAVGAALLSGAFLTASWCVGQARIVAGFTNTWPEDDRAVLAIFGVCYSTAVTLWALLLGLVFLYLGTSVVTTRRDDRARSGRFPVRPVLAVVASAPVLALSTACGTALLISLGGVAAPFAVWMAAVLASAFGLLCGVATFDAVASGDPRMPRLIDL
ncbi:hypothetical protein [Longispora urticae]